MEPFVYRARLFKVIDGDTIDVILDLGFGLQAGLDPHLPMRLRLLGVNTRELHSSNPELRKLAKADMLSTVNWLAMADTLRSGSWPLLIRTQRDDAFGRYLADVYAPPNVQSLSDYLLELGVPPYP